MASASSFSGERVQAQIPYTGFDGTGDSVEHHRFGGLMAIGADHAALLGPTTITVHNHTDMAGYLVLGEVGNTSGVAERSCGNVQRRVINVLKAILMNLSSAANESGVRGNTPPNLQPTPAQPAPQRGIKHRPIATNQCIELV